MRKPLLLLFISLLVGCAHAPAPSEQGPFKLPAWVQMGSPVPRNVRCDGITVIDSNYLYGFYPVTSQGIAVDVLTHQSDKRRRIQGVATQDPQCETPEGISPGARYGDIRHLAAGEPRARYGWGHFWKLPSCWTAFFLEGRSREESLTDDSRVLMLIAVDTDRELGDLQLYRKAQPGATDNPDDAQRSREDH